MKNSNNTPASNMPDNTSNSSITPIPIKTTSSEEKKINDFLDSVHKETISEKNRGRILDLKTAYTISL